VTRYEPGADRAYEAFVKVVKERHSDTLFSEDGSTVDEQVAALLRGEASPAGASAKPGLAGEADAALTPHLARSIATAESCTGGMLVARLTELAGSSEYVNGGIVAYSNEVKVSQAGVDPRLIERHGAVSGEVAESLADGASSRLDADVGVGVTGVAGPGGGSAEKPVGLVWLSVATPDGGHLTRSVNLPGGRADVRDRATTVAMHLIRRALVGS
jgi:nicotinamide-nucleotide amidase